MAELNTQKDEPRQVCITSVFVTNMTNEELGELTHEITCAVSDHKGVAEHILTASGNMKEVCDEESSRLQKAYNKAAGVQEAAVVS